MLSTTLIIIIITTLVSLSALGSHKMMNDLIFHPPSVTGGQWWRFFTCGLIHADFGHLFFNMFALYLFGGVVEKAFIALFGQYGTLIYLLMYVLALAASLLPSFAKHKDDYNYRSLGASGAVSAVIFASILFNPLMGIGLFFIKVFIAGFLFGIIYLLISSWLDRKGGDNINHSAHIYGALFGIGFTILACKLFSHYPVVGMFLEQIKNMRMEDLITTGGGY